MGYKSSPGTNIGRPTKCTPETQAKIVDLVRSGVPLRPCFPALGLSHEAYYTWMRKGQLGIEPYADFFDSIKKAEAECEAFLAARWRSLATSGGKRIRKTIERNAQGQIVKTVEVEEDMYADWRGIAEFMLRRFPERWGRVEGLDLNGIPPEAIPLHIRKQIVEHFEQHQLSEGNKEPIDVPFISDD